MKILKISAKLFTRLGPGSKSLIQVLWFNFFDKYNNDFEVKAQNSFAGLGLGLGLVPPLLVAMASYSIVSQFDIFTVV